MSKIAFALLLSATISADAATYVAVDFPLLDNSSAPELAGYVTQDIRTHTSQDWTATSMRLTLTSGSVYQFSDGSNTYDYPPHPSFASLFPEWGFDTYVGIVAGSSNGIAGPAGDLGSTATDWNYQLDTAGADLTWFDTHTSFSSPVNTIGRLSLSSDAQGTLAFALSEANSKMVTYEFPVVDGRVIPDPCALIGGDAGCSIMGIQQLNDVLSHWNQSVPNGDASMGDYKADGFVGIADLNFVLGFWNSKTVRFTEQIEIVGVHPNPGDDGFVGIDDLNVILTYWNQTVTPSLTNVDYTGDGYVGQDDLNVVLSSWNAGTPPALVPEPASLVCLLLGTPYLLTRARRVAG